MPSLRRTFLDGTDADLQRRLTPGPGALNIWHGKIGGNAHIRPSGNAACKGRKPAARGLQRTHEKKPHRLSLRG